jgi:type II secretory pathway component PulF
MKYWQYRGYNSQYQIQYGVEAAKSFSMLALHLRQRGISIIEAQSISKSQYLTMLKTIPKTASTAPTAPPKIPFWLRIVGWFLRGV